MQLLHTEYERFLQWLRTRETADDSRRVAKIVAENIDTLAPLGTAGGQRAIRLTPLLREGLEATTPDIEAQSVTVAGSVTPWSRLEDIVVGPFRGFRFEKTIPFSKRYTLIYGPNGAGKTSLCEALEFALLGEVKEAAAKRLDTPLDHYLKNIHEKTFTPPVLHGLYEGGVSGAVSADADQYRFCFIEKNRIDDFARLSARTSAKADSLIALLFGLDAFDAFINGFTNKLKLEEESPRRREWDEKQRALEASRQVIAGEAEAVARLKEEEGILAHEYQEGATFDVLLRALGRDGTLGRLQELQSKTSEQLPPLVGVTDSPFRRLRALFRGMQKSLEDCQRDLEAKASDVSFRDLYRAVLAVSDQSPDACPACETPLSQANRDPFDKAKNGLLALEELSSLEERKQALVGERAQLVSSGYEKAVKLVEAMPHEQEARRLVLVLEALNPIGSTNLKSPPDGRRWVDVWRDLLKLSVKAKNADAEIHKRRIDMGALQIERDRLLILDKKVEAYNARRDLIADQVRQANQKVAAFDQENSELRAALEIEVASLKREERLAIGYGEFLEQLSTYRNVLPETLVADLNETARELYNSFNVDDPDVEKLATLILPSKGGDPIWIEFNGRAERHNALQILSEGHIRCLGLAILLAKNIKLGLPLIVFDDVVNAIDHDHRGAIRDSIFAGPEFAAKQIVMTCHSNEFIKDIQNHVGVKESELIVIKHHAGDFQPRVITGKCRAYLDRAEDRLEELDHRAALANSRQALEYLTQRIWKSLANKRAGEITLNLVGPGRDPELRMFVDQLRVRVTDKISDGTLGAERWAPIKNALDILTGVPQENHAWLYLNKGTHDEFGRDDFEEHAVRQIVTSLRAMDTALGS